MLSYPHRLTVETSPSQNVFFAICTYIKSWCCTPATNIMLYVNYISIIAKRPLGCFLMRVHQKICIWSPAPASSLSCQPQGPLSSVSLKLESPPCNYGPLPTLRPVGNEIGKGKHHSPLPPHLNDGIVPFFHFPQNREQRVSTKQRM